MRALLAIAVLLALPSAAQRTGRFERFSSRCEQGRSDRGFACDEGAFFELAPASGAGLGAACAGAAVTSAGGAAVVWQRRTVVTCSRKGTTESGILPGDLVSVPVDLPAVEPDYDGVLSLRFQSDATNEIYYSEDFASPDWHALGSPVFLAPVVTADYALAPDGTLTADRVQFSACSGALTHSVLEQTASLLVSTQWTTVYLTSTDDDTYYVTLYTSAPGGLSWTTCTATPGSYSRCALNTVTGGVTAVGIGCVNNASIANTGAADVLLWGAQAEASYFRTSYVKTEGAAVTRDADGPVQIPSVSLASLAASGSASATISTYSNYTDAYAGVVVMSAAGRPLYFEFDPGISDGTNAAMTGTTLEEGASVSYWSSWAGATLTLTDRTHAFSTTAPFTGTMDATGPLQVGADSVTGLSGNWWLSRICLDPNPSRCR